MKKVILLDNGHGCNTPGKCSPDKSIREFAYAREITKRIQEKLTALGYKVIILVPETRDVALSVRARRANEYCDKYGAGNCLLVSIHLNAAGNGSQWMNGQGWEVWTTVGNTNSDKLADCLFKAAEKHLVPKGFKMRCDTSDGDYDKEKNFTIIYMARCPAVLTENLFQDNKREVDFLLSEEGKETIADLHVDGIIDFINKY